MNYKITHTTHYNYMERVFLEPHVIRLTPRADRHARLISRAITVTPPPQGINEVIEMDGTMSEMAWFKGMTNSLEIRVESLVAIEPYNPFDFLIYPSACLRLPMNYPGEWPALLAPYMGSGGNIPEVQRFAAEIAQAGDFETVTFLTRLCRTIYEDFEYEKRETGQPYPPAETLRYKRGSCRDFVVLAMAACRQFGLACRYVSGYYLSDDSKEPADLHGWLEVFLPGAGWKGLDPSHGIACDHHHLVLSAAADPAMTMPVTGSFRGFSSCRMRYTLSIQEQDVSKSSQK